MSKRTKQSYSIGNPINNSNYNNNINNNITNNQYNHQPQQLETTQQSQQHHSYDSKQDPIARETNPIEVGKMKHMIDRSNDNDDVADDHQQHHHQNHHHHHQHRNGNQISNYVRRNSSNASGGNGRGRNQSSRININGKSIQTNNTTTKLDDDDDKINSGDGENVKVSDIIGDFGPYQIAVVIFAALRAMSCAIDGLSGPFVSPSIKNFQCDLCIGQQMYNHKSNINSISNTGNIDYYNQSSGMPATSKCSVYFGPSGDAAYVLDSSRCFFTNPALHPDRINCNKWNFDNNPANERLMNSLTIEQSLVCDREWLKSLSNSLYFIGATMGLLFWGIISDRYGRKTAYMWSHFVTLIFGFSALFANSMTTYIILRSINAFGMIGELIPRSILVEMVATRYRFVCSVICQIGWATGIILVPVLSYINPGYRFILAFPVLVSFLMLPWLIWLPESARWLIINNRYDKAKKELIRAATINKALTNDIDLKIEQYNRQVVKEEVGEDGLTVVPDPNVVKQKRMGVSRSIIAIFTNMHLLKDTLSVFTLLFVAEVVYFSLTLNVADLSGSLYINYIISGVSELFSIACCGVMLAKFSRRKCLSILLLLSTISYLLMALVNVYESSLPMTTILAINAFGKLTAIGNLMVIILISQEVYPTVIRQFGTSLCITVGKLGSAAAPFTHELGQIIGQSYCFAMFSLICLGCAFIPFGLSETGNVELPDTVVDVETSDRKRHRRDDHSSDKQKPSNDLSSNFDHHRHSNSKITIITANHKNPNGIVAHYERPGKTTIIGNDINNNNNDNEDDINNNIKTYDQEHDKMINNEDGGLTGGLAPNDEQRSKMLVKQNMIHVTGNDYNIKQQELEQDFNHNSTTMMDINGNNLINNNEINNNNNNTTSNVVTNATNLRDTIS